MPAPIFLLQNPHAGSTEANAEFFAAVARRDDVRISQCASREEAVEQIGRACREGVEVVMVAGGDGSVNAALEGLMRAERPASLGVLPLGTGNDLARTLALPLDPYGAFESLLQGERRPLDVLEVRYGGEVRWAANMVTAGNTGRFMQGLTPEMKKFWGPFCYLRGVVDVIDALEAFQVSISLDDESPRHYQCLNIFAANGRTSGGGMPVSPFSSLEDGLIDLVLILDGSPLELASLGAHFVVSDYMQHDLVRFHQAQRIRIESNPHLPFSVDGDLAGESTLDLAMLPGRISILVGADYQPTPTYT